MIKYTDLYIFFPRYCILNSKKVLLVYTWFLCLWVSKNERVDKDVPIEVLIKEECNCAVVKTHTTSCVLAIVLVFYFAYLQVMHM